MTVPGTFKNRPPAPRRMPDVPAVTASLMANGAILVEHWVVGECSVIVASEPLALVADETTASTYRWHLSIAHPKRYPTWDEIKTARYGIPTVADVDFMAQLLPKMTGAPGRRWTNAHDNCFHLYQITPDVNLAVT